MIEERALGDWYLGRCSIGDSQALTEKSPERWGGSTPAHSTVIGADNRRAAHGAGSAWSRPTHLRAASAPYGWPRPLWPRGVWIFIGAELTRMTTSQHWDDIIPTLG